MLVLEKHNLPGGCTTSFVRGRFEFEATLHEMCQMGRGIEGEPRGAVRELLEGYGLDVDWVSIDEAFCAVATDENGFNVSMPLGVQAFIDEMERQVPGSRESMTNVLEIARMMEGGVNWLGARHNHSVSVFIANILAKKLHPHAQYATVSKVEDHGDVYIPEDSDGRRAADKKFGWVHPCCSYPISDVTLDVPVLG